MSIEVRLEQEEAEVTLAGILPPFKRDYMRNFIPGLTTVYVTVDGVELAPMTPEQYAIWNAEQAANDGEDAQATEGSVT